MKLDEKDLKAIARQRANASKRWTFWFGFSLVIIFGIASVSCASVYPQIPTLYLGFFGIVLLGGIMALKSDSNQKKKIFKALMEEYDEDS